MDERSGMDRGASSVEYGLLITGIAVLLVVVIFALGPITKEMFSDTCDSVKGSATNINAGCGS